MAYKWLCLSGGTCKFDPLAGVPPVGVRVKLGWYPVRPRMRKKLLRLKQDLLKHLFVVQALFGQWWIAWGLLSCFFTPQMTGVKPSSANAS